MDATALTSSASRLLEALEKFGVSQGADLRSTGSLGTPPRELVEAFEHALEGIDAGPVGTDQGVSSVHPDQTPFQDRLQDGTLRIDAVNDADAPERMPSSTTEDGHIGEPDAAQTDRFKEIERLTNKIVSGSMRPEELYRLQYLVGVLKVQTTAGQQTSQTMGQGMENILKNSQ